MDRQFHCCCLFFKEAEKGQRSGSTIRRLYALLGVGVLDHCNHCGAVRIRRSGHCRGRNCQASVLHLSRDLRDHANHGAHAQGWRAASVAGVAPAETALRSGRRRLRRRYSFLLIQVQSSLDGTFLVLVPRSKRAFDNSHGKLYSQFTRGILMNSNRLISTLAAFLYVGSLALAQNGQGTYQDQGDRGSVTVPAGTEISVRTNEAIDSQNASEGQHYSATVLQDIRGGAGETLIPKDSNADLVIRRVNSGGTIQSGNVVLDLDSITVNGRRYRVSTEDLKQSGSGGIGKNRRTAEMVGGGAALGTLLGAIAGGGKGAAIGAVAGAGAGGTAQVLTKGKTVKVPAETILRFQLDRPLHLSGY